MMQEMIEKASQLYTGFVNMPGEYQVVASVGALVVLAALKNVWKLLQPVRWSAATLLRSVAFVLHPRKRKVQLDTRTPRKGVFDTNQEIPFDASTKDGFIQTVKHHANKKSVKDLSNEQINLLFDTAKIYEYRTHNSYDNKAKAFLRPLIAERDNRLQTEAIRRQGVEAAKAQEVAKVPFHASRDDVI